MESYIGHGGQFLFPFLFGKDLQVIFTTEVFITNNLLKNPMLIVKYMCMYWYRPKCQIIFDHFLPNDKFANSSVTFDFENCHTILKYYDL